MQSAALSLDLLPSRLRSRRVGTLEPHTGPIPSPSKKAPLSVKHHRSEVRIDMFLCPAPHGCPVKPGGLPQSPLGHRWLSHHCTDLILRHARLQPRQGLGVFLDQRLKLIISQVNFPGSPHTSSQYRCHAPQPHQHSHPTMLLLCALPFPQCVPILSDTSPVRHRGAVWPVDGDLSMASAITW
jgi:hypothetical protein